MPKKTLIFTIPQRHQVDKSDASFHLGMGANFSIKVKNSNPVYHNLRMGDFRYTGADGLLDPPIPTGPPFSGCDPWSMFGGEIESDHTINDGALPGHYSYSLFLEDEKLDDPEIVIDSVRSGPGKRRVALNTLTLTIAEDGQSVAKSADPFHMGTNGSDFQILVINTDVSPSNPHQLRIENIHNGKGVAKVPFDGPRSFLVSPGGSKVAACKVKDKTNAPAGRYSYQLVLDNTTLQDPEIVVDSVERYSAMKKGKKTAKPAKKSGQKKRAKKR